jgi:hypothetical protein
MDKKKRATGGIKKNYRDHEEETVSPPKFFFFQLYILVYDSLLVISITGFMIVAATLPCRMTGSPFFWLPRERIIILALMYIHISTGNQMGTIQFKR